MIIKSLLFVIICIFVWETFQILNKMTEEYFVNLANVDNVDNVNNVNNVNNIANEQFVNLSDDPVKNDISKTIAINCKAYPVMKKKIMVGRILKFKRISVYKIISIFDNSFIFNLFIQFITCSF